MGNINYIYFSILFLLSALIFIMLSPALSYAQVQAYEQKKSNEISINARVLDSTTLISGKMKISLWGVENLSSKSLIFDLKARQALEHKIGNKNITCVIKGRIENNFVKAQCINSREEDLSLFLLRFGFASANRREIYKTIYEVPYLRAEEYAKNNGNGIWGDSGNLDEKQSKNFLMAAIILIVVFVLAIGVLSIYFMRVVSRVIEIQNKSIDLAAKERSLKDKEKYIIASMINAEIRSNKAKIEAYLRIYEETLKNINDSNKFLEYKKSGDIIQRQPSLSRSVFDGNTSKLDLFGSRLASEVIHYYARIKTRPDYVEIKPDTSHKKVKEIIENAVNNAKKLDKVSDKLLDSFVQHSLIKNLKV